MQIASFCICFKKLNFLVSSPKNLPWSLSDGLKQTNEGSRHSHRILPNAQYATRHARNGISENSRARSLLADAALRRDVNASMPPNLRSMS